MDDFKIPIEKIKKGKNTIEKYAPPNWR